MTFAEWWDTLTEAEHRLLGKTNAAFVWLCATQAERKWQGLTAKERTDLWWSLDMSGQPEHTYGRAIEAKLKEKNNG